MRSTTRAVASVLLIAGAFAVLFSASGLALADTIILATGPTTVLSYDGEFLSFEGRDFTPGGMVTGYIDGQPAWDTGPVGPDGNVLGVIPILLLPGQHTAYLVDVITGQHSNTVKIAPTTTTVTTSSTSSSTGGTSTPVGTVITITAASGKVTGSVTVTGYLKDAKGKGLPGLTVRITVDGAFGGRVTTTSGGFFSYTGAGPTTKTSHVVAVWYDGGIVTWYTTWPNVTVQYAASSATRTYTPS